MMVKLAHTSVAGPTVLGIGIVDMGHANIAHKHFLSLHGPRVNFGHLSLSN